MAWIHTVDDPEPDSELATLYGQMVDPFSGAVDNILKVHSLHPAGLAAHWRLYRAVMAGTKTLRKVERELIAFVVSRLNHCHY